MIYLVRFLEILLCGVIPSAGATYVIRREPNVLLWAVLCVLAFVIFVGVNAYFSVWLLRFVKGDKKEYLRINLVSYAVYILFTIVAYNFTDAIVFSFVCANMRGFENLLRKTRYTVAFSHFIAVISILVIPYFVRKYDERMERIRAAHEEEAQAEIGLMIDIDDDAPAPDDPFRFDPNDPFN